MDARFRGMFLASAGFLFASIGFTLSVLSTFLRLFVPSRPTHGAEVASIIRRRTLRRSIHSKHRRSHVPTPNSSNSTSTSTSLESGSSTPSRHSTPTTGRGNTHNRMVSEPVVDERPDFRNAAVRRHRRSGSAPPSPAPWATSHSDGIDAAARTSVDDSALGTFSRQLSFDAASSFENDHALKSTGLSFLHRRKVRKASSTSGGMREEIGLRATLPYLPVHAVTAEPLPLAEKKKSQLFAPLLHRRHSQMHDVDPTQRLSQISFSGSIDQHDDNAVEGRPSQDTARVLPKRSQTLRTQPYEAPYFFPTPGSVAAETYLPPRRKPVRSKTLAPDELGVLQ